MDVQPCGLIVPCYGPCIAHVCSNSLIPDVGKKCIKIKKTFFMKL